MAYEQTAVPVSRTQEQIRRMVLENGGSGIAFISQPPTEGFEAMVVIDGATRRKWRDLCCTAEDSFYWRTP